MSSPAKSIRPAHTSTKLMIAFSKVVFPRTIGAEQYDRFVLMNHEIDVPQDLQAPVAGSKAGDLEKRSCRVTLHSRLRGKPRRPADCETLPPAGLRKSPCLRS